MIKILFSINCFQGGHSATNNGNLIYPAAWARFLNKNRDKLKHDFIFMNAGFDPTIFRDATSGCLVSEFPHSYIPSDADATYECLNLGEGYDYVARVDPDMFPSVEALNIMSDFLEKNPDIDLLSPACARQAFWMSGYPDPIDNNWEPWGHPTVGDCIVFFKRIHFLKSLDEYTKHPLLTMGSPPRPFSTCDLNFGQVCDTLDISCLPELRNKVVGLDGQISSDFWTMMCKVGMNHGDIVNYDNRSFGEKNHIHSFAAAMKFPSFEEVVDGRDISIFGRGKKVIAPFLHTGMSYTSYYHYNAFDSPPGLTNDHLNDYLNSFYSGQFGAIAALNVIIEMLTRSFGDQDLLGRLLETRKKTLETVKVSSEEFNKFAQEVSAFYRPPLQDYLE
jgi:hypothetical protein